MNWKDATTYSRDDKERKPTTFSAWVTKSVKITVTSGHIIHKGYWVMHFRPWFDTYGLGMPADEFTAEEAQAKAMDLARASVQELYAALCR